MKKHLFKFPKIDLLVLVASEEVKLQGCNLYARRLIIVERITAIMQGTHLIFACYKV